MAKDGVDFEGCSVYQEAKFRNGQIVIELANGCQIDTNIVQPSKFLESDTNMSGYQRLVMDENQQFLDFAIVKSSLKEDYSKMHKSDYQKMMSLEEG